MMKGTQSASIKSSPIDQSIVALSRKQVCELLAISDSQLRRDTWVCGELSPKGWRYAPGARGYGRDAIEILWIFRQLVSLCGRAEAIAVLNQTVEKYHVNRQESCRAS